MNPIKPAFFIGEPASSDEVEEQAETKKKKKKERKAQRDRKETEAEHLEGPLEDEEMERLRRKKVRNTHI